MSVIPVEVDPYHVSVSGFAEESSEIAYLPAITKWTRVRSEQDPRTDLLLSIAKKNIAPFTKDQEGIFTSSRSISKTTKMYLGPRGYALVVGFGLAGGLAGVRLPMYFGISEETLGTDAIPFCISATVGVTLAVLSMIFTGTFPDQKSDAADDKERECLELKKQFDEAGMRLISLFWSKKEGKFNTAIPLARAIQENLPAIQEKLRNAIQTNKEDERIVELLKTAVDYVVSSGSMKVHLSHLSELISREQASKGSKIPPSMRGGASAAALQEMVSA
ncbi:MAG: hypothetical protein NTX49_02455 [Chlamydiae bacterium]|nr:hypothetical protein [Chlamydiota bacterium]